MAKVIFYEKPGCINNTKQKALLQAAGHELEVHNLLTEPWTVESLRLFLGQNAIATCFNRTAPLIKSGEIDPDALDAETALSLMIANPILIRRPLLQVCDRRVIGFDLAEIDAWIGLDPINDEEQQALSQTLKKQDLETCPQSLLTGESATP
jgi:nitrogenase-associated protein